MKKLLIVILLLFTTGCGVSVFSGIGMGVSATATAVSGVMYWKNGESHKYYKFDTSTLHQATLRAIKKLQLTVKSDEQIPLSKSRKGTISGYRLIITNNDKLKIRIRSVELNISEVTIRVNILGDKPYAKLVYDTIDNELCVVEFTPQIF